jgi:hypothetical protein
MIHAAAVVETEDTGAGTRMWASAHVLSSAQIVTKDGTDPVRRVPCTVGVKERLIAMSVSGSPGGRVWPVPPLRSGQRPGMAPAARPSSG